MPANVRRPRLPAQSQQIRPMQRFAGHKRGSWASTDATPTEIHNEKIVVFFPKVVFNRPWYTTYFGQTAMPAFDLHASSLFIASAMPAFALVISIAAVSLVAVVVRNVSVVRLVRTAPPGTERR